MLGIKCGVLLDGAKSDTIKAVKLAMDANKSEKKATAALEQALSLLTSGQQARTADEGKKAADAAAPAADEAAHESENEDAPKDTA